MNKTYNEPEFKVVITRCEDVITTSGGGIDPSPSPSPSYTPGAFESDPVSIVI